MTETTQNLPAVLRPKKAAPYCGVSLTQFWRLEQTDPDFPKKLRFSKRCVGYRVSDLDAYLQKKQRA